MFRDQLLTISRGTQIPQTKKTSLQVTLLPIPPSNHLYYSTKSGAAEAQALYVTMSRGAPRSPIIHFPFSLPVGLFLQADGVDSPAGPLLLIYLPT